LRRLGTDYVDLYQLHRYDEDTPMDETLEALDTVVRRGKARYVGVSNWPAYRVARALGRSEAKGLARIDSVQPRYNLLFRAFERDLLPLCEEEGIAVIPYNPIAGGLISGKHDGTAPPAEGTRFALRNAGARYQARYWLSLLRSQQYRRHSASWLRTGSSRKKESLTTEAQRHRGLHRGSLYHFSVSPCLRG
jgi:1-deoxyxylulose-5-phosphate synthase